MTTDYKATLNLPKTAFPMKASLAQREPARLKQWLDDDLYGQIRKARAGAEPFILPDGPPYANGDIHIGHAVNKVLKDIIVKAKTLSGFDAPYIPGWDCHGLPIELQVEKKVGKAGHKVDARAFRQACREYAGKQVDRQREDFKRLGVLGDWDHPYLTMQPKFEADQLRAFAKMIANGHLERGFKPVHWCTDCGSALAEAEVEYEDKTSPAIDVRFAVADVAALATAFGVESPDGTTASVPIWTTTPWTLPANEAVSLNPEFDYRLVDAGGEWLVLADGLADAALARYGLENTQTLSKAKGDTLAGLQLDHPLYAKQVPVIVGDHVTLEAGTGAVHTAPGHGVDDFNVGKRHDLPVNNPVGPNGVFFDDTELVGGQHVFKANAAVIEALEQNGKLLANQPLKHSYPHCWRHKTPVIFRATPQWFISMDQAGLRDAAIQAIPGVEWTPGWGEQRIAGMVEGRPDWCISRQRTWGVPIALFVHKQTGEPHPDSVALLEKVAERVEQDSIDAWFDLDPAELLGDDVGDYDKVTDIMDVWFDSGVVHHCVLENRDELRFPADLYLEGSDQHRGWFQSSLLTSVAMNGVAPYRGVLTHGFTVDADGRKMSKSLGNVVAPQKVMNSLGGDVLRLWVAATDYRGEMTVSDEILNRVADSYRRIRNTLRYLLSNLNGFDVADALPGTDLLPLDRWIIRRADALQAEVIAAYDNYELHLIYQKVHRFCVAELGAFYLDVIKDRQYTTQATSQARRSTQTAMFHIAEAMLRWLAPILSFTADEAWAFMPGERDEPVFCATWHAFPGGLSDDWSDDDWETLRTVRDEVSQEMERLRKDGAIGGSLEAEVTLFADGDLAALLQRLQDELRFVLISSSASVASLASAPAEVVTTGRPDLKLSVSPSKHDKCTRCWHRRPDVGDNAGHPELCARCVTNVEGNGEQRNFA